MAKQPGMSKKTCRLARDWFQRGMRITDWYVDVVVQDDPPEWVTNRYVIASCKMNRDYKTADVWVSIERAEAQETDPLSSLFHELLHVVWCDTGAEAGGPSMECSTNCLGDLMARAYRAGLK